MLIKIGQTFIPLSAISSVTPRGTQWEVQFINPQNPRMMVPIDKNGHEVGAVLESIWEYTQMVAKEYHATHVANLKAAKEAAKNVKPEGKQG